MFFVIVCLYLYCH